MIETAREQLRLHRRRTVLFVDEIHRFNKAQRTPSSTTWKAGCSRCGATTENPAFEVIAPLMSRCRVMTLERLNAAFITVISAKQ